MSTEQTQQETVVKSNEAQSQQQVPPVTSESQQVPQQQPPVVPSEEHTTSTTATTTVPQEQKSEEVNSQQQQTQPDQQQTQPDQQLSEQQQPQPEQQREVDPLPPAQEVTPEVTPVKEEQPSTIVTPPRPPQQQPQQDPKPQIPDSTTKAVISPQPTESSTAAKKQENTTNTKQPRPPPQQQQQQQKGTSVHNHSSRSKNPTSAATEEAQERLYLLRMEQAVYTQITSEFMYEKHSFEQRKEIFLKMERVQGLHATRDEFAEYKIIVHEERKGRRTVLVEEDNAFRQFYKENYRLMMGYVARDRVKRVRNIRRSSSIALVSERERTALRKATRNAKQRDQTYDDERHDRSLITEAELAKRTRIFQSFLHGQIVVVMEAEALARQAVAHIGLTKLDQLVRRHRVLTQSIRPKGSSVASGYDLRHCQALERAARGEMTKIFEAEVMIMYMDCKTTAGKMSQPATTATTATGAVPTTLPLLTPRPPARSYPSVQKAQSVYGATLALPKLVGSQQQSSSSNNVPTAPSPPKKSGGASVRPKRVVSTSKMATPYSHKVVVVSSPKKGGARGLEGGGGATSVATDIPAEEEEGCLAEIDEDIEGGAAASPSPQLA